MDRPPPPVTHSETLVPFSATAVLAWDYSTEPSPMSGLFSSSIASSWDPEADLDWNTVVEFGATRPSIFGPGMESQKLPLGVDPHRKSDFQWHLQSWLLSQFLHGEQGALLAAGRLVEIAPSIDLKLCAAAQTLDEAKHVVVFSRYLDEKLGETYPVNRELQTLLVDIIGERRWDMVSLGMQILVEGVALSSFSLARSVLFEPLAKNILRLVLRDEARHVALGVSSLLETYDNLSSHERAERIEFVKTALSLLRARFSFDDVCERLGVTAPPDDPFVAAFRSRAMSRMPPILRRLGLWDEGIAGVVAGTTR